MNEQNSEPTGQKENLRKALLYGMLASFFFAFTFILNRMMNLSGGFWLWGACLRYFFMLPVLWLLLSKRNRWRHTLELIKRKPVEWILWSTVGFGLFYAPMSFASVNGESWLVASCWQLTILCGLLMSPLFQKPIPKKQLGCGLLILAGVFLLMWNPAGISGSSMLVILPILVAAFCYPLGNRKMMAVHQEPVSTLERVFGMTLCSMPFWLLCAVIAGRKTGFPAGEQMIQSLMVALFSGVLATLLFFRATDMTKHNQQQLVLIEATQCGEVVFAMLGGILISGDSLPGRAGMAGIVLIVLGMIMGSLSAAK